MAIQQCHDDDQVVVDIKRKIFKRNKNVSTKYENL